MMYFVVFFCSPLYFLVKGKILGLLVNSLFYGLALFCILSFVGAIFAPFPWMIAMGHAAWHLRRDFAQEQATMIATAIAKEAGRV